MLALRATAASVGATREPCGHAGSIKVLTETFTETERQRLWAGENKVWPFTGWLSLHPESGRSLRHAASSHLTGGNIN